jgi:hypothetical protein
MRFAHIEINKVENIIFADQDFADAQTDMVLVALADDSPTSIGDLWDGTVFTPAPSPVKSPEEVQTEIVGATQERLDVFARTRNYDSILSVCTYATSSIPKFAAEGQYAVSARDNTWATLYNLMEEVQTGVRPLPAGFSDIEPLLPALTWPA